MKHEQAKQKFNRGGVDALQDFDYLYLKGPTIAEQKTYGLAIIRQKKVIAGTEARRKLRQMEMSGSGNTNTSVGGFDENVPLSVTVNPTN